MHAFFEHSQIPVSTCIGGGDESDGDSQYISLETRKIMIMVMMMIMMMIIY